MRLKNRYFSFNKFPEVTKELGPEMKSTGESIRFIKDTGRSLFQKIV
jgi:carbamoyl-phosphate synthase large subunit